MKTRCVTRTNVSMCAASHPPPLPSSLLLLLLQEQRFWIFFSCVSALGHC